MDSELSKARTILHPSYQIGTFPLVFSADVDALEGLGRVELSKEGRYLKITKCNLGQLYDDVFYAEQLPVDQ